MSHIANFISVIKVGVKCSKTHVKYNRGPKFLINFIKAIYSEGLILRYAATYEAGVLSIKIFLKPNLIKDIRIVSTPGRKSYVSVYNLKSSVFKNPRVVYILSTSSLGIVSSNIAIEKNVGGELLCKISF